MATYEVTGPDGATYEVNAPDTASQADVLAYAKANYAKPSQPAAPVSRMEKIGTGMADPIHGGAQLLTHILPTSVVDAGNAVNNWLADKTGLVAKVPTGGVDQMVRSREAEYQQKRAAAGESGFDGYRTLGNVFSPATMPLAFTGGAPAASMAARMAVGAGTGAAGAALTPALSDQPFADEKTKQMLGGAMFGAAMVPVASAVGRVISPKASTNPNVQLLRDENVTPTIGQALGGRWNTVEEKLQSVPIVGDSIANARERAREQFNNAAINRAVDPIGQRVEGAGQDAVKKAGDLLSNAYDAAKSQMGAFAIDQQARTELNSLRQLALSGLDGRERKTVESYFRDYLQKPGLTSEAFKQLDSKLGTDIRRFSGSSDVYQQQVGDALAEAQRIIRENAMRANPAAAGAMRLADKGYANLVRVEGAATRAANQEGVFTPGQLNMAVRAADSSVRDRATARGTALMQDLANAGQQVLGNKVPNSGTTDRALMAGLGGAFVNPAIPLVLLAGGGMYTKPMQGLLSGAVAARPQSAQAVADALRQASPGLGLLGGQVGAGFLTNQ